MLSPASPGELAEALAEAARAERTVRLGGAFTKHRIGSAQAPADLAISTRAMTRVLKYEPRDLTVSVEAGIRFSELNRLLAAGKQMIPLDPPWYDRATVGGVLGANHSGARRRLFGTARDMVIGMHFATLEGKLIQTGGMVVKNVAGLDMGKLMIGSFGTLAAIAVVNFKVFPLPEITRTFVHEFETLPDAIGLRDRIVKSVLQPAAVDLIRDAQRYRLLVQAGGSAAAIARYAREVGGDEVAGGAERLLWEEVRESIPRFIASHPQGVVVRVSCLLSDLAAVLTGFPGRAVARAATGVCYGFFESVSQFRSWSGRGVVEYAPEGSGIEAWSEPGSDFAVMERIKHMFDPKRLLNPGRLYGRI